MRNVHEYDGKVPIRTDRTYTDDEVSEMGNDAGFWGNMKPCARSMAQQILTEPFAKNVDVQNGHADARQLLAALLHRIRQLQDQDRDLFLPLLEEQLTDMKTLGPCPQGRTIRLWQLLQSLS
jgi:hypothetical protein